MLFSIGHAHAVVCLMILILARQTRVKASTCSARAVSWRDHYHVPPPPSTCSTGKGWAMDTTNIIPNILSLPNIKEATACCDACSAHSECRAWTANNVSGCGLKNASWEKGGHPGSISGTLPKPTPPGEVRVSVWRCEGEGKNVVV